MNKWINRILVLVLVSCCLASGTAFAASPVWMVQSGQNKIYLVGTIHLLRKSDYPLPASINRVFANSSKLAFETDIAGSHSPQFAQAMLQSLALPPGKTMKDYLTPNTFKALEQGLAKHGIDIKGLQGFSPVLGALTLTLRELAKMGVGSEGVDMHLYKQAQQNAVPTEGLETLQQHLDYLGNMGQGQEEQFVLQTLEDLKQSSALFEQMVSSWRQGDLAEIEELFVKPTRQHFPKLYDQLLVERNHNWKPILLRYLTTPEVEMVLVGSAHLAGEEGLLNLLKREGYQIKQLD